MSACNSGDLGSIPGLGRSPGEGNGNPLQYSCLENPMDGQVLQATVHGVTKSQTLLSNFSSFLPSFPFLPSTPCPTPALPAWGPVPWFFTGAQHGPSAEPLPSPLTPPECPGSLPRAHNAIHLPGSPCELLREACRAGLVQSKSFRTSLSLKTARVVFSSWLCYMMIWF